MDYLGLLIHAALLLRRYENTIIREEVDPLFALLQKEIALASQPPALTGYYATGSRRDALQMGIDRARIQKVLNLVYARLGGPVGESIALVAENHARKVEAAIEHRAPIGNTQKRDSAQKAEQLRIDLRTGPPEVLRGQTGPPGQPAIDLTGRLSTRAQQILDGDSFDGATYKRWVEIGKERTIRDTNIQTQLSRVAKESPTQLRERLLTNVTRPAQMRARALTRTFALNVSNALAWEKAEQDDRVKGYRLLVTLDGRTSLVCINYAAEHKFYLLVPGNPRPPFHYSCRTILFLVVEGHEKEKPPDSEKWLQSKSAAEQDEILGPERAEMYRRGEISLAGLINSENRVLDLAELRGVSSSSGIR